MTRLKVSIDALVLGPQAAGIGQYIRSLVESYQTLFPEDDLAVWLRADVDLGCRQRVEVPAFKSSRDRLLFEQLVLPRRLARGPYDVVHFPDYQVPILYPLPRLVMTVHDLAAFVLPGVFPRQGAAVKRFLMKRSVPRAARIIVPSAAIRDDLVNVLNVPPAKVRVVPHGVKRRGTPKPGRAYDRPYFLAVGTVEPRKNFDGLIRAYHLLRERWRDVPDLLIVGQFGWMYQETLALPEKLGVAEKVKFLQYVLEDSLATLYRDAVALVYPSFYEGFGLPVVEAMQAGIPVITAGSGALGELGGDFVWRVDPRDVASIADAMQAVLADDGEAKRRAQQARALARQYTWERAAAMTRQVYQEVAEEGG
ncbi:MAG: glycosyltransferase family 1 protein [Firmicutes bacterium]|nr:glycosyltransferase family 1 protein [Bacillota bacterium]